MRGDRFSALRASVDAEELAAAVAAATGVRYRLLPLDVKCTYPVFRGEADGAPPAFVKVGSREDRENARRILNEVGAGPFARFLTSEDVVYRGLAVSVMEWRASSLLFPEDMTAGQADRFADECAGLSVSLSRLTGLPSADDLPLAPARLYGTVADYARRHPRMARLLRRLLDVPVGERTFGDRPLVPVHGDFHAKNFGFRADGGMSVYDLDRPMLGLACGDLANALVERFSCLGLSSDARRRLAAVTRRIVARAPWPRADFVTMGNVLRLQFAARRLGKHPDAAWVALDVWRRDRRIREFLDCL